MDIYQILVTHNREWTAREFLFFVIVFIVVAFCLRQLVKSYKIVKAKKNYGYARLMNIVTPSENRVEKPACPMARRCGGCQIQEMKYGAQLAFKEGKVRGNLERIGEVPTELLDKVMQPIVGMEEPFHYRNKAQFPIGTDKEDTYTNRNPISRCF